MKQVQLKIEEFFDGGVVIGIDLTSSPIYNQITDTIKECFSQDFADSDGSCFFSYCVYLYGTRGIRETIIKALWEFQKTLTRKEDIPELFGLGKESVVILGTKEEPEFYNRKTRIITITEFGSG